MVRKAIKCLDGDLQELSPSAGREKFTMRDHPLRQFFMERRVSQVKLAKRLGVVGPWISESMRGIRILPDRIEAEMYSLRDKILAWEEINGRRFGSPSPKK